ncbi:hypothetical protein J0H58_19860 [bacterium]|nr:hypothetical protein [bacterium]
MKTATAKKPKQTTEYYKHWEILMLTISHAIRYGDTTDDQGRKATNLIALEKNARELAKLLRNRRLGK